MSETIGYVVGGGLKEGLRIRLTVPADAIQEGSFVVCDSGRWRYYGLVTDLQLGATDPRFADEQPTRIQTPLIRSALLGKTLYTTLSMFPTLMLELQPEIEEDRDGYWKWQERADQGQIAPRPVKTVPAHHAAVRLADKDDVAEIFPGNFEIGTTIEEPHHPVRLDLGRLVKRSSGIFGATGTGKSFTTRMVLAGIMRDNVAVALVFDMHNEYGYGDIDSDRGQTVAGLQDLFGGTRVQVVALGAGTQVRGHTPSLHLEIGSRDITPGDIRLLGEHLGLNESAAVVLDKLENVFGLDWLQRFMELTPGKVEEYLDDKGKLQRTPAPDSVEAWARQHNIHESSANALHRKLTPIYRKPYVVLKELNPVTLLIDALQSGRHVVLSFGQYEQELDYLLVSNILTRRIREHWVRLTNDFKGGVGPEPRPLVIAVEEAHKLLSPAIAPHTAFGTIARELRKYYVTLLVIDQRPSGIDSEIMSQLGTRITGWLGDEDDIHAVLTGLAGRDQLRGMLARLQEKEEVLLLGWGVKMPIPIKTRRYDARFAAAMREKGSRKPTPNSVDLFNDDAIG